MTRLWRLPTALLMCAGLLLAFSSTALPYRSVVQQIIPDGIDDLDSASLGGGTRSPGEGKFDTDLTTGSRPATDTRESAQVIWLNELHEFVRAAWLRIFASGAARWALTQ